MGRPRKGIGEVGEVSFEPKAKGWIARARVRMPDGTTSRPRGHGATKTLAELDLRERSAAAIRRTQHEMGDDPSLSDLIDLWLRTDHRAAKISEMTRGQYQLEAERIRERAGQVRASQLTTMQLEGVLFAPGTGAPSSFRTRKVVLGQILTAALRRNVVLTNPVPAIALPDYAPETDARGEPITLTEAEGSRLLEIARAWQQTKPRMGPRRTVPVYLHLALAFGVGLRAGEIRGLHWSDFNATRSTLHIHRSVTYAPGTGKRIIKEPKTRSGVRIVHAPAWVRAAIVEHRAGISGHVRPDSPILAARNGEYMRDTSMNQAIRNLAEGTEFQGHRGLGQIGRRTNSTLITNALGPAAAAAHLGHSKIDVTAKHYIASNLERPDVSAALEGLGHPHDETKAPEDDWR